ncbi:MAG: flagellar hook-length control protein FliK [Aminivibrio sp.]|uniref:flagellar hook-length control protein FliK n=1 Tax=Aminivibrio sp. TaxID=1872489 RepID=UPI002B1FB49F|nr:flagellar hook-length control protein FliK [Aminivibrio sp.]MEA4951995.1 flagellar hook-length control protein FliK [Aminivibrio sp.]
MISPFLAAAREKSPSELFPDQAGTKLKPEGEKSDRFARLLHRCEQQPEVPLTDNGPKEIHSAMPHAAFTAMLRRMTGVGAGDAAPLENGGAEAALSEEETEILISGEIPGEGDLSQEEALSFPGTLPPESSPDGEFAASAAGMVVRDDVSLPAAREGGRGMTVSPAEEQGGPASGTVSSFGFPSKDNVPGRADAGFLQKEASGNPEMNEQEDLAVPEKRFSDVLSDRDRPAPENQFSGILSDEDGLKTSPSAKNEPVPGKNAEPLSAGISGNGDGEKGEGRQSMSGKNDGTGAALFSQRPAQGTEGVRTERFPVPGGFARELALAGRNGEALEDGMHNVVRFMRTEGHHRASMIVDPPALGRVEIELASTSGGVEASIRVGNEQLRQLVQDQITVLRTHLQQQGVQVAELTVDIRDSGREGHGEARDGAKDRNARVSGMAGTAEEDIPSFAVDLEKGLLHWVA